MEYFTIVNVVVHLCAALQEWRITLTRGRYSALFVPVSVTPSILDALSPLDRCRCMVLTINSVFKENIILLLWGNTGDTKKGTF